MQYELRPLWTLIVLAKLPSDLGPPPNKLLRRVCARHTDQMLLPRMRLFGPQVAAPSSCGDPEVLAWPELESKADVQLTACCKSGSCTQQDAGFGKPGLLRTARWNSTHHFPCPWPSGALKKRPISACIGWTARRLRAPLTWSRHVCTSRLPTNARYGKT